MPDVNELLNSSSENDEEFQRLELYALVSDYVDDEGPIEVVGRTIGDTSNEISVEGENSSQYLQFIMPRYYDGIDLTTMTINIHYEIEEGIGSNDYPVNAYYSDEHIKFGWIIPQQALMEEGTISFCIFALGSHNNRSYVFKTETKKYVVQSGLDIMGGIIEPDENWYLEFIERLERTTEELIQEAYEAIDQYAQQSYDIDTELSTTSAHAIANSAVATALNGKQSTVTVQNKSLMF